MGDLNWYSKYQWHKQNMSSTWREELRDSGSEDRPHPQGRGPVACDPAMQKDNLEMPAPRATSAATRKMWGREMWHRFDYIQTEQFQAVANDLMPESEITAPFQPGVFDRRPRLQCRPEQAEARRGSMPTIGAACRACAWSERKGERSAARKIGERLRRWECTASVVKRAWRGSKAHISEGRGDRQHDRCGSQFGAKARAALRHQRTRCLGP